MSCPTVPLGEVSTFIRGITFKPDDVVPHGQAGSLACFRTKNVQDDLDLSDVWAVPEVFAKRPDKILREGDLLVSTANSWNLVGKCSWVPRLDWPATLGGFISCLRPDTERVEPRYLYRWFSFGYTQAKIRNCARQTTNIANLSIERCEALEFPLPPLPEQRRIAAILDRTDALRRLRRQSLTHLSDLGQATFFEMFGDPNHLRGSSRSKPIGEFCSVSSGSTPRRDTQEFYGGDIPWVKTTEVKGSVIVGTEEHITEEGKRSARLKIYPKGTILIAMYGQGKTRGNAAILGLEATINQASAAIQCGGECRPKFLFLQIKMAYERLRALGQGGNQPNLNAQLIKSFPVLLPDTKEQDAFLRRIEALDATAASSQDQNDSLDHLFASLQHRAFRGDL